MLFSPLDRCFVDHSRDFVASKLEIVNVVFMYTSDVSILYQNYSVHITYTAFRFELRYGLYEYTSTFGRMIRGRISKVRIKFGLTDT